MTDLEQAIAKGAALRKDMAHLFADEPKGVTAVATVETTTTVKTAVVLTDGQVNIADSIAKAEELLEDLHKIERNEDMLARGVIRNDRA